MKNRIELAKYFDELGFKKGVEVGVCTGRYSKILLDNIPGLQLLGVDPYVPYGAGGSFREQLTHDNNLQAARQLLAPYPNYVLSIGYSHDVAQYIADGSLDFVFIDGIHDYENAYQDISDWAPKVRKGGIVSGHDYHMGSSGRMQVVPAVDKFVSDNQYKLQTTEWDYEAFRDDQQPDWYFVKEH